MENKEMYYAFVKALNALQNSKPRDASDGSIKYHQESIMAVKVAIKMIESETDIYNNGDVNGDIVRYG